MRLPYDAQGSDRRAVAIDRSRPEYPLRPASRSLSRRCDVRQPRLARQHLQPIHQVADLLQLSEVGLFRRVGEDDLASKLRLQGREGRVDVAELVGIVVREG